MKNMDLLANQFNPFNGTQLCSDYDADIFFPEYYSDLKAVAKAKEICGDCWMQKQCLEYAMQDPRLDGIWGATTPLDRKRLRLSTSAT